MNTDDPLIAELGVLVAALVEDGLSADQRERLSELLRECPDTKLFYKRYLELHAMLDWEAGAVTVQGAGQDSLGDLPRTEERVDGTNLITHAPIHLDADALTRKKYVSAFSYVIRHTFTLKRVAIMAAAAVLLIGAVLTVLMLTGPGESNPVAEQMPPQTTPDTEAARRVATLTAEFDAAWHRRPDADLFAGQRFTLTRGMVEVTTADGAIAVIAAPATFEFVETNTIRLEQGRMAGICETDTSKGFLVRTPDMDITDLGTRFGVEVVTGQWTEVHVLDGEVEVMPQQHAGGQASKAVRLVGGEAARGDIQRPITRISADVQRFGSLLPITIELPGTGQGLAIETPDTNWQVIEYEGQRLKTPFTPKVAGDKVYGDNFLNDPATSQWVFWPHREATKPTDGYNNYLFQTQATIPDTIDPATARIELSQVADTRVSAIIVNGQRLKMGPKTMSDEDPWYSHMVIDQHLVAGKNTIVFEVLNRWDEVRRAGPVGLRVQWKLHGYGMQANNAESGTD